MNDGNQNWSDEAISMLWVEKPIIEPKKNLQKIVKQTCSSKNIAPRELPHPWTELQETTSEDRHTDNDIFGMNSTYIDVEHGK